LIGSRAGRQTSLRPGVAAANLLQAVISGPCEIGRPANTEEGIGGGLDPARPSELIEPLLGYAAEAIEGTCELARDGSGRIGMAAEVSGKEHGVLEASRAANRPQRRL
jgi:hypothetical protein